MRLAHTVAAAALMAAAILVPAGLWLYARAASADMDVTFTRGDEAILLRDDQPVRAQRRRSGFGVSRNSLVACATFEALAGRYR